MDFLNEKMGQFSGVIEEWEWILDKEKPDKVVEIGTGSGAFSTYLLLWCLNNGAEFVTVDSRELWKSSPVKELLGFRDYFVNKDIFETDIELNGKVLVFCDGGNKKKEFKYFWSRLKEEDLIAVHDVGEEFPRNWIEKEYHFNEAIKTIWVKK